jgi:hypothetical protein
MISTQPYEQPAVPPPLAGATTVIHCIACLDTPCPEISRAQSRNIDFDGMQFVSAKRVNAPDDAFGITPGTWIAGDESASVGRAAL